MQLTIKLKKRWITSVLAEAGKTPPPLPWQSGRFRKPVPGQKTSPSLRLAKAQA